MTADEAARVIARGVAEAIPSAQPILCPLSDGGEGFADVLEPHASRVEMGSSFDASMDRCRYRVLIADHPSWRNLFSTSVVGLAELWRSATYYTPLERLAQPIPRRFRGRSAIVESAEIIGWGGGRDTPVEQRTTYGLADPLLHANRALAGHLIIGLGGSSTIDGGLGFAESLGVEVDGRFVTIDPERANRNIYRADGKHFTDEPGGDAIERLASATAINASVVREWKPARITAACDVANPLLGPHGAARTYAPQKGATPEQVERLEAGLTNWARIVCDAFPHADPDEPGAGAAGGLGFALRAFLNADLRPGIEVVFGLINFHERLKTADLVITGEGKLDAQTTQGKVVAGVARAAAARGLPVIAIVGGTDRPTDQTLARMRDAGAPLTSIERLIDHTDSTKSAMADAQRLAQQAAERALRAWNA